jgi:arabinofuranan 3-O-arabinosyltransferase
MINSVESHLNEADLDRKPSRSVDIFNSRWLQSFGFAFAMLYVLYFVIVYRAGSWIVGSTGLPIYTDFAVFWAAGTQTLHGNPAALYDSGEFMKVQAALFPLGDASYPSWSSYPPTFLLVLAPLALLPYRFAFITWDMVTLLGCIAVVYLIVRRRAAIALALAAPFTAWNFIAAQNGFLTASLLGASLLFLDRRPMMAGAFIGCLTYKPQFGILFPVALIASHQWRAIASAGVTVALLAAGSVTLFGTELWAGFPHALAAQGELNLLAGPESNWGYLQSAYGLIRSLHGPTQLAWLLQGLVTLGGAVIVWIVWRSRVCYELKAAILSAAALLATPYAFAYDMAAIVIPAAFLATDQLSRGLLRGEKTMWIVLFGAPLAVLATLGDNAGGTTFGGTPVCLFATLMLFCVILRRVLRSSGKPSIVNGGLGLQPASFR